MSPMLVDANAHVAAPKEIRSKYPLVPLEGASADWSEDLAVTPEDLIRVMDDGGVHQAFLMAQMYHGFDSGYCADAVARFPDRFVGVANVDIFSPGAEYRISYWIEERGMHGIRFWGGGRGMAWWIDDPRFFSAWERVHALGVPCDARVVGPPVLPNLRRLLEHFPDLAFTITGMAHIGGHDPAAQTHPVAIEEGPGSKPAKNLLELAEFPRVYVSFPVDFIQQGEEGGPARDLLLALLEAFGSQRLLWTSYYPGRGKRPFKQSHEMLRRGLAFLSEEDQDWILGGTARELYPALKAAWPDERRPLDADHKPTSG